MDTQETDKFFQEIDIDKQLLGKGIIIGMLHLLHAASLDLIAFEATHGKYQPAFDEVSKFIEKTGMSVKIQDFPELIQSLEAIRDNLKK